MEVWVGGARLVGTNMETPQGPMRMRFTGEYREVKVNERLTYTESMSDESGNAMSAAQMGMPEDHPTTTEVIIELEAADHHTRMVQTHLGVAEGSPGAAGWTMVIEKLDSHIRAVAEGAA